MHGTRCSVNFLCQSWASPIVVPDSSGLQRVPVHRPRTVHLKLRAAECVRDVALILALGQRRRVWVAVVGGDRVVAVINASPATSPAASGPARSTCRQGSGGPRAWPSSADIASCPTV